MSEDRVRVRAFQIGVEPQGSMLCAYLLPPDGQPEEGEEKIMLASVRHIIFKEPGVKEAFNEFLKAIALAMVTRHVDPDTAASMQVEERDE